MKNAIAIVSALVALFTAVPTFAADKPEQIIYFDYDEFLAVRSLDPEMQESRLCGLNKVCMRLWKNGEMKVPEHGMVVRADFDGDGETDIGVAMERDKPNELEGLDYFVMAAAKTKDGSKLLQTYPLVGAHTIIEMYWDSVKKSMAIDSGERQLTSESTVTLSDGNRTVSFSPKTGAVEMRLTYLRWNDKSKKFDTQHSIVKS